MKKLILITSILFNLFRQSTFVYYWRDVGIVPVTDAAGITQEFKPGKHYGIDIGWHSMRNCRVLSWQDGEVIGTGYFDDTGYWVAVEHSYDIYKRWTVYIHLTDKIEVKKGQEVLMGDTLGYRGNTGKSHGEHLHFYLTSKIDLDIEFNFTNLKKYSIDPVPYLYYSKKYNTIYVSDCWTQELPKSNTEFYSDNQKQRDRNEVYY